MKRELAIVIAVCGALAGAGQGIGAIAIPKLAPIHFNTPASAIKSALAPKPVSKPRPPVALVSGTLRWANGETLPGELIAATGTSATWKTPIFEDPVELGWQVICRMDWTQPPAQTSDPFLITLRDGSSIQGDLVSISGSSIVINGSRCGQVELKRSEVLAVRRTAQGALLAAGPAGDAGWEQPETRDRRINFQARMQNGRQQDVAPFAAGAGDALSIPYWNRGAFLKVTLPDAMDIEFHVHAKERLDFRLSARTEEGKPVRIETWDKDLVIAAGDGFKLIRELEEGEHDVALRLCWNSRTRNCSIYTPAGDLITDWQAPADHSGTEFGPGLLLLNKGRELSLEMLRIRKWNGDPPPKIDVSKPRLELANGRIVAGETITASDGAVQMRGEGNEPGQTLALSDIEAFIFSPDRPKATDTAQAKLTYADGTCVQGRIAAIQSGSATLETSFAPRPLIVRMDGLRQLLVDTPPTLPPVGLDTLEVGKEKIHGTLAASDDVTPRWLPVGAAAPVAPAKTEPYEILRTLPANLTPTASSSLFFTRSGDVLSGSLHAVDRAGVEFDSALAAATKLAPDLIEAIQCGGASHPNVSGFTDPSWRILKGNEKSVRRKADSIEMDPGTSIGNAGGMQASEIRFRMSLGAYSVFRMRLFCMGLQPGKSTNLIFMSTGGQVICGAESTEGQLEERIDAASPGSSLVVRVVITEKTVDVYLNGLCVENVPILPSSRAGSGLIIEPASLWGNTVRPIKISEFAIQSRAGLPPLPNVDPDAKAQAMTIPRFRRDDPPAHALIATNGDILRGEIEEATTEHFGFRSGLDQLVVPRDRVQAVVWLGKPLEAQAAATPPNPGDKVLNESVQRVNFGRTSLANVTNWMQAVNPDLKFKLPKDADSASPGMVSIGGEPMSATLDKLCALFGVSYRVDDKGVIILEGGAAPTSPLMEKVYWLKPGSLPGDTPANKFLAGKGITFPGGATAGWQAEMGQLAMRNTPENQARLEKLVASDLGGAIGSPTHWLELAGGARLGLAVDKFGKDIITGWHPLFGKCSIPTSEVATIRNYPLDPNAAMRAVADWHTVYAPEPVLPTAGGDESAAIGKPAAEFKLALLEGGQFDLSAEKGKIVVLDFWATWCGPCIRSLPGLIQSMAGFSQDRVKFVGVNEDEPAAQVKQFLDTRGWKLSVALDAGQAVGQKYGVDGIPHTVIIGPDGKVTWTKTGYAPDGEEDAAKEVNLLLAPPATSGTAGKQ